jgi:hypothetical protein
MKANERDDILQKYLEMKAQAADLEGRLSEMREKILESVPSGKYGEVIVVIDEQKRESFAWKEAKAKLSEHVLSKLNPFVNLNQYRTLKVTRGVH